MKVSGDSEIGNGEITLWDDLKVLKWMVMMIVSYCNMLNAAELYNENGNIYGTHVLL